VVQRPPLMAGRCPRKLGRRSQKGEKGPSRLVLIDIAQDVPWNGDEPGITCGTDPMPARTGRAERPRMLADSANIRGCPLRVWAERTAGAHGGASPGFSPQACSSSISHLMSPLVRGAMGTTEDGSVRFHSVSNDSTAAVGTAWRKNLDRAFETVKHMGLTSHGDLKGLIVVIAALFALGHVEVSSCRCLSTHRASRAHPAGILAAPAG
jgi:hypothetical protein